MSSPDTNGIATRESWKVLDLPEIRTELDLSESYTHAEVARIKRGVIPEEMEDKWFIFFEEPWLYFHRSWTGEGVYGVEFRTSHHGALVVASWVGRGTGQHMEPADYHRAMLIFLIDALLLGKPASFPMPNDLPPGIPHGLYQHHVAGSAYSEVTVSASQAPSRFWWWARLLRCFRRPGTGTR